MAAIVLLLATSAVDLQLFESVHIISGNASQLRLLMRSFNLTSNRTNLWVWPSADWRESPCQIPRRRDGCALAHLRVLNKIAAGPPGWHLVFEDDAEPSDFVQRNDKWAIEVVAKTRARAINLGPSDPWPAWGELLRHPLTMMGQYLAYQLSDQWLVLPGWNAWAHAYMVDRIGAARIVTFVAPRLCDNHWDVTLGHQARWAPEMQFIQRVYLKHAGWPTGVWRNFGLFGQRTNHASTTN